MSQPTAEQQPALQQLPTRPITKHSRAKRNGTLIKCPECGEVGRIYHYAWSACTCRECRRMIEKLDYLEVIE